MFVGPTMYYYTVLMTWGYKASSGWGTLAVDRNYDFMKPSTRGSNNQIQINRVIRIHDERVYVPTHSRSYRLSHATYRSRVFFFSISVQILLIRCDVPRYVVQTYSRIRRRNG